MPASQKQFALFRESLDNAASADHPIRVLERCLELVNWEPWEGCYAGRHGAARERTFCKSLFAIAEDFQAYSFGRTGRISALGCALSQ